MSRIPKRYWNIGSSPASAAAVAKLIREDNPKIVSILRGFSSDIVARIQDGDGLFLYGKKTGTGKTTTATAFACDYIRESVSVALSRERAVSGLSVLFIHVPTFMRSAKQVYEEDSNVAAQASSEVASLTRKMLDVPLLVLDDIGAEKPSEAVRERLLTVIDHRSVEGKSTIYTSNMSLEELEITLGSRIRSRIQGGTFQVPFEGTDHRRS